MLAFLRPSTVSGLARGTTAAALRAGSVGSPRTAQLARFYATYRDTGAGGAAGKGSSTTKRRGVTVLSDDGRYEWGELTGREKVARATQQSVNFVVVLAGAVLTVSLVPVTGFGKSDKMLMRTREVCLCCCTRKCCPRTAVHGSSRRPWSGSKTTHDARMCLEIAERSRHMATVPGAGGRETGPLRKD